MSAQKLTGYVAELSHNESLYEAGQVTKHHTYDSVFFIAKVMDGGYRATKFYNGGEDMRVGSLNETPAEAYNEALLVL